MWKRRKRDFLLAAALLACGVILALVVSLTSSKGGSVIVRVDGEILARFSLAEDTEYLIQGAGGGTNQLIIQDGEAWVEEASCPDHLCMGMGKISRAGQSIICLPNKVVVEIEGQDSVDGIVK